MSEERKCDFCSSRDVVVIYPATDFTMAMIGEKHSLEQDSIGGWLACEECQLLIAVEDYDALVARVIAHVKPPVTAESFETVHDMLGAWIKEGFVTHRTGEPIPLAG